MINEDSLKEAEDFYNDRIVGWMIGDLFKSIDAGTNFLTALGCMVYTEVIGTMLPPLDNENGRKEEKHFYRCFYRMPSCDYTKQIDDAILQATGKRIYSHIRNSMSHTYYPAIKRVQNGNVMFVPSVVARDGLVFDGISKKRSAPIFIDNQNRIVIATKNYANELSEAVEIFQNKTFNQQDEKYQKSAIRGMNYLLRGIRG
ncbi:MAG: hypothetical protein PHW55_10800 [Methanothrix sp.]|nr:hypothetical protein [Methanothrix sp.]